jgi:hypothetical protein
MFDHVLVTRSLLAFYRTTEIHNELLRDESVVPGWQHSPGVRSPSLR